MYIWPVFVAHTISYTWPSLAPAPRILDPFLHPSIDEGKIGRVRNPSWEMKTIWIKLLQNKVSIEHCPTWRALVLLWKEVTLSLFSPLFPTPYLAESSCESCALCRTQHAWQSMWGVIWTQTALGFLPSRDIGQKYPVWGQRRVRQYKTVTELPSCQGVEKGMLQCA